MQPGSGCMCRIIKRESETLSLALRLEYVMAVAENRMEMVRVVTPTEDVSKPAVAPPPSP